VTRHHPLQPQRVYHPLGSLRGRPVETGEQTTTHRGSLVEGCQPRIVIGDKDNEQACRSVALAFSLTRCLLPGGSKKLSPAL